MTNQPQNLETVNRAIAGDAIALKLLLTAVHIQLRDRLSRKIPASMRSLIDPEDVLQEVHVEVFKRIESFEPQGEGSFERWVSTIAITRLRNLIKRYRALKRGGDRHAVDPGGKLGDSSVALFDMISGTGGTPSRSVARGEAVTAIQIALAGMPEHYCQAIQLVHLEGKSVRDAAQRMNKTERAIHGLLRRGLALLQERLGRASRYLSQG
ncbi:MAG: RNA polymerase sigma factor [Planctomycetota bacterium]